MVSWTFVSILATAYLATVYSEWRAEEVHQCSAGCPSGFFSFEDSCYVIPRVRVSWGQAVGYCRALNSELLTIETNEEQKFLQKELAKHHGDQLWVAATDLVKEGHWIHALSTSPVLENLFSDGQPDNLISETADLGQNCAVLNRDYGYRWTDENCADTFNFVCEKARVHTLSAKSELV